MLAVSVLAVKTYHKASVPAVPTEMVGFVISSGRMAIMLQSWNHLGLCCVIGSTWALEVTTEEVFMMVKSDACP